MTMRNILDPRLRRISIREGAPLGHGLMGAFVIESPIDRERFLRIVSSGPATKLFHKGWEHISVSVVDRCPTWDEMSFVRDMFWRDDELVLQFHPPRAVYVNQHAFCLHLWKSSQRVKLPPRDFV